RGDGRRDDGEARRRPEGALRDPRGRDSPPRRARGDRRAVGRDRGQRRPSARRPRRLPGRDRHPQGRRAALEERGVRGRRRVGRVRLGTTPDYRAYEPIQPRGTNWRGLFRRLTAPLIATIGLAVKLGSLAKFSAVFIAFGGYSLIWGWKFALGVVVLIFV